MNHELVMPVSFDLVLVLMLLDRDPFSARHQNLDMAEFQAQLEAHLGEKAAKETELKATGVLSQSGTYLSLPHMSLPGWMDRFAPPNP